MGRPTTAAAGLLQRVFAGSLHCGFMYRTGGVLGTPPDATRIILVGLVTMCLQKACVQQSGQVSTLQLSSTLTAMVVCQCQLPTRKPRFRTCLGSCLWTGLSRQNLQQGANTAGDRNLLRRQVTHQAATQGSCCQPRCCGGAKNRKGTYTRLGPCGSHGRRGCHSCRRFAVARAALTRCRARKHRQGPCRPLLRCDCWPAARHQRSTRSHALHGPASRLRTITVDGT